MRSVSFRHKGNESSANGLSDLQDEEATGCYHMTVEHRHSKGCLYNMDRKEND